MEEHLTTEMVGFLPVRFRKKRDEQLSLPISEGLRALYKCVETAMDQGRAARENTNELEYLLLSRSLI
jgi:hypothetical protein